MDDIIWTILEFFIVIGIVVLIALGAFVLSAVGSNGAASKTQGEALSNQISNVPAIVSAVVTNTLAPALSSVTALNATVSGGFVGLSNQGAVTQGIAEQINSSVNSQGTQLATGINTVTGIAANSSALTKNDINTTNKALDLISVQSNTLVEYNALLSRLQYIGVNVFNTILPIWNIPQNIIAGNSPPAGNYLFEQLLDAHDNHIQLSANQPITVNIFNNSQYAIFALNQGITPVNTFTSTGAGNSINFYFNLSEGCGGYVYVIYPTNDALNVYVTPNATAKYNPGNGVLTGVCKNFQ